ncbi:MAG: hypothetical protein ABMA25_05280 [Ilumatobacteraceae bacterium]
MRQRLAAVCAAVVLLAACGGDDAPAKVGLYDRAPVPAVPDRTTAIDLTIATNGADGLYWSDLIGMSYGEPKTVTFLVTQAFFAAACIDELGPDDCPNDYGTIDEPSRTIEVPIADLTDVTVVAENQQNYVITPEELLALTGGEAPSTEAPGGYQYVEFPYLLTMRDGKVVEAHQIWVP